MVPCVFERHIDIKQQNNTNTHRLSQFCKHITIHYACKLVQFYFRSESLRRCQKLHTVLPVPLASVARQCRMVCASAHTTGSGLSSTTTEPPPSKKVNICSRGLFCTVYISLRSTSASERPPVEIFC